MGGGGIKMYLEFRDFSSEFPERKTKTFSVINKRTKEELGEIKWNSRWRKYCYFSGECFYCQMCLQEIVTFIHTLNNPNKLRK